MPRLRLVEAWPATRFPDRPWHDDPDVAAFLGSSRGIFDLYSDELPAAELTAPASSVRFFVRDDPGSSGFEVSVHARFEQGFDVAWVVVPEAYGRRPAEERARAALDVIHAAMRTLAPLRGWDADRLDEVRARVEARGLRFRWSSPWKASPGRRHRARGVFWLADDGLGHVQLEIRGADDSVTARSEPALAFMTREGFVRSASTLRWAGSETVTAVPWCSPFEVAGQVSLTVADGVAALAWPDPLLVSDARTAVTTSVAGAADEDEQPYLPAVWLEVVDTVGHDDYSAEQSWVCDALAADPGFLSWWSGAPFRKLRVRVCVPDSPYVGPVPRPGARKSGKDLVLQVVTDPAGLPEARDVEARRVRARDDLHEALTRMAGARGLPAPPPLPPR